MNCGPSPIRLNLDMGPLNGIISGIKKLVQRLYSTESERMETEVKDRSTSPPGSTSAARPVVSRASSGAGPVAALGGARAASRPTVNADEEPTRRARWIPGFRLPERIRWGLTPATRYRANGEPYIIIPLGADSGNPSFRTISPSSPGWFIPARLVEIDDDEGDTARHGGGRSAASPATSAARPAYSQALRPRSPAEVVDHRVPEAEGEPAPSAPNELVEQATGGAIQRAMARIYAALFGGSNE